LGHYGAYSLEWDLMVRLLTARFERAWVEGVGVLVGVCSRRRLLFAVRSWASYTSTRLPLRVNC